MKKDQFIVVCADNPQSAERLIPTAHHMSEHLHKDIILLTCAPDGDTWVKNFGVPYIAMHGGDWKTVIDSLPTAFNAVLAITLCNTSAPRKDFTHPKQVIKNFRECKVAYLVMNTEFRKSKIEILNTALTIDHLRESKEKLIWASYMARFLNSRIRILHFDYRDATLRMRWHNNMRYLDKIFSGLNITYSTEVVQGSELGNPDLAALKIGNIDLFIFLVPDKRDRDLGDLFTSSPELRILQNDRHLPILMLNQRDDLYIMCD